MVKPQWTPRAAAQELRRREAAGHKTGVLFGPERIGLMNDEIVLADAIVYVPLNPNFASLNLAAAVQVIAHELRMAGTHGAGATAPGSSPDPVTAADMEGLFAHLEQALADIGFYDPDAPKLLPRRLRRMFSRMAPDRTELNILRGILTAAQKAARR